MYTTVIYFLLIKEQISNFYVHIISIDREIIKSMSGRHISFDAGYGKNKWHDNHRNLIFPIFGIVLLFVVIMSTVIEEYHKESEKYNDVISAQIECKKNPPKSAHNSQACWEANLKASRSPLVVALSNTGVRIFDGFIAGMQTIAKSYLFTALVAIASAILVLYCLSSSNGGSGGAMIFHHGLDNFNPYFMMQQRHTSAHVIQTNKKHQIETIDDDEYNDQEYNSGGDLKNVNLFNHGKLD